MPNALGEHPRAHGTTYVFARPDAWLQDKLSVYYFPHVAMKYAGGTVLYVYHGDELVYSKDLEQFLRDFLLLSRDNSLLLPSMQNVFLHEQMAVRFDAAIHAMVAEHLVNP